MRLYNLKEDRADVIVPALQIYVNVMRWIDAEEIFVPKIGLADGLIQALYRELQSSSKSYRYNWSISNCNFKFSHGLVLLNEFKSLTLGIRLKHYIFIIQPAKNGSQKNYDPYPSEYENERGTDFHDYSL